MAMRFFPDNSIMSSLLAMGLRRSASIAPPAPFPRNTRARDMRQVCSTIEIVSHQNGAAIMRAPKRRGPVPFPWRVVRYFLGAAGTAGKIGLAVLSHCAT